MSVQKGPLPGLPRHFVVCLGILVLLGGCSGEKEYVETPVFPVSGNVTVRGEPAYGAYVLLHPVGDVGLTKGNKPFARVGEDGVFNVTTYDTSDGAPAGEYKVTVIWPENPEARGPSPDRLRGRYATPDKSVLKVTVEESNPKLPTWELE
ncbi:hypothetical protein [Symmachiella dynata]|uniref:hypothetical protein n=1 Tax=Symmachiella dynata TaxID=2527995 RepID=UPI0030EC0AC8|tara:strand:- start:497 stop:946 length:450 start_codon:yes stop_codon:yes gene_type:complete